jgi:GTPase involved in cell partitioning and DNA repair
MKSLAGVPQLLRAENGFAGGGGRQHGRKGKDTIVLVPVGTLVTLLQQQQTVEENNTAINGNSEMRKASSTAIGGGKHARSHRQGSMAKDAEEGGEAASSHASTPLPEWLQQWRKPWRGAVDYDPRASPSSGKEEKEEEREDAEKCGIVAGVTTSSFIPPLQSPPAQPQSNAVIVADLVEDGQEIVLARGGHGGRGNAGRRRGRKDDDERVALAAKGEAGERVKLGLELKLLADVALVGFPNVGKSTVLRALTNATPRVGEYAFTTLQPQLGVLKLEGGRQMTIADVPGT